MQDIIKHYIKGHFETELDNPVFDRHATPIFFQLNYYDTFTLLALTGQNILYLTEEIMRLVILHKMKLIFEISYNPKTDIFALNSLYFKPSTPSTIKPPKNPVKKLERPLLEIRSAILKQPVNIDIENVAFAKRTIKGKLSISCVQIKIIPKFLN